MINVVAGRPFVADISGLDTGLASNLLPNIDRLAIKIVEPPPVNTLISGPYYTQIIESVGVPGAYGATLIAPTPVDDGHMYWVVWDPPTGQSYIDELLVSLSTTVSVGGILPDVALVASLLRARTKDVNGDEIGTFNANTRPTSVQVGDMIQVAADDLRMKVRRPIPAGALSDARRLIAMYSAMLVELSYWPEQVHSDRSAYSMYKSLYDTGVENMTEAINVEGIDLIIGSGDDNAPTSLFPEPMGWDYRAW